MGGKLRTGSHREGGSSKHIAIQHTLYPALAFWELSGLFGELVGLSAHCAVRPEKEEANYTSRVGKGRTRERK